MNFIETEIAGVFIVEPKVFTDARGHFFETWNRAAFAAVGLLYNFVQDNQSCSTKGVLRGLHFQKEFPQGKLVRVVKGSVFDVAVDLRINSVTYGKAFGLELTDQNKKQFLIPKGFAHGFLVLSDEAVFTYKVDNVYAPSHEASIKFDDKTIGIKWPLPVNEVKTSPKDLAGASFEDAEKFD